MEALRQRFVGHVVRRRRRAPRVLLLDVRSEWVRALDRKPDDVAHRGERSCTARPPLTGELLLLVVPRLRHHGLQFNAHRDCRDRLNGLILLLVEHGHRPLRAFTIHKVLESPRRSAGLRAVPPCSVQFGDVAAMRRAFLVKPKR